MEVVVPKWGLTIDTVIILEKYRANGDMVKEGEPICGVETDKATAEIEATSTGILTWAVEVNDEVAVGAVIARIQAD